MAVELRGDKALKTPEYVLTDHFWRFVFLSSSTVPDWHIRVAAFRDSEARIVANKAVTIGTAVHDH